MIFRRRDLNLIFMTLMGVGYFSTAITEEKEEDTLGLMLMAGISPLGILLGKSVGRLIQALLLIAMQYPFTLLAVTLGGISQDQIRSTYVALLSYMVMLSGIGLLCSTLAARSRSAAMWFTTILFMYLVVPSFFGWLSRTAPSWQSARSLKSVAWISESCVFLQMSEILTTGFQETLVSHQMMTNSFIGGFCFLLSWVLFGMAVREPSSEPSTRGLVARPRGKLGLFLPGRTWFEPFVWKDFHFVAGGVAAIFIRIAVYGFLYLIACAIAEGIFGMGWTTNSSKGITGMFLVLTMFAIALDAGFLVSRSLHEEVRGQTLACLMMLPATSGMILYGKIAGTLLCWLIGPVAMLSGILILPEGPSCVDEFFRHPGPPFWLIAHLIFVPHAAALAAMYVRWGAFPLAIGIAIGSIFLSGSLFQMMRVGDNSPIVWLVGLILLGACAVCHVAVWLRASAVSAR